jgi:hypothetical protein
MNKEFIPYEQALALKQLGFNEPCFGYYVTVEVPNPFLVTTKISDTQGGYFTFAPLFQQAFRWFREKYNLNGILNHYPNTKIWDFSVHNLLWNGKEFVENVRKEDKSLRYSTYEEAELACLIKLIEIVKNK